MVFSLLIFGTTGFIGKNLVENLCNDHIITSKSLRSEGWQLNLENHDVYINLIGKAHDQKNKATESDFYQSNFDLTRDIFNVFLKSDAHVFIHISSIAALEEIESNHELIETDECNPISWYGKSKRSAEKWLMDQKLPSAKKLFIIRPPMVHGAGDKGNLGLLYRLVSKGIPYPLASFKNKRSFISIDNFCFFINEIIENKEKLNTGIYHISDDETVSTSEIISIIKKVEKKNVRDLRIPQFFIQAIAIVGDILPIPLNSLKLKKMTSDLIVSNQKIKTALGIKKLPLSAEEGLIKTIESFKTK